MRKHLFVCAAATTCLAMAAAATAQTSNPGQPALSAPAPAEAPTTVPAAPPPAPATIPVPAPVPPDPASGPSAGPPASAPARAVVPDHCKSLFDDYDAAKERRKFLAAAGVDNEMDQKQFDADKAKGEDRKSVG
jgi:hypothetical protein